MTPTQIPDREYRLQTILWISLGAIAGANLRYAVAQSTARMVSASFPYGTLLVNFTGSLILGLFMVWTTERVLADPRWRLLIAVGFCGGYTTYSSYAYETFVLLEKGQWFAGAWNMILTNVLCLAGVLVGAALARAL
jgi:CrcB protein